MVNRLLHGLDTELVLPGSGGNLTEAQAEERRLFDETVSDIRQIGRENLGASAVGEPIEFQEPDQAQGCVLDGPRITCHVSIQNGSADQEPLARLRLQFDAESRIVQAIEKLS